MTYVVKTAQEVVDHFEERRAHYSSRAISAESETKGSAPSHLRGKSAAMQEVADFLNDLFIGEVRFTDIKEITYKPSKGDWFKRLHRERVDTLHRVEALKEFVAKGCPGPLMAEDKVLLTQQLTFMRAYLGILEIRWQRALVSRAADDLNELPVGQAIPVDSSGMRDSHT